MNHLVPGALLVYRSKSELSSTNPVSSLRHVMVVLKKLVEAYTYEVAHITRHHKGGAIERIHLDDSTLIFPNRTERRAFPHKAFKAIFSLTVLGGVL